LAVSKRHSAAAVTEAFAAGLPAMGENYVQEALAKMPLCPAAVVWHFIGKLQSNKTRAVAEHFDWVQTVTSLKLAERLNAQRPAGRAPLNVCVQIQTDREGLHGGVPPDSAAALCAGILELPQLRLRGLMTIPAPATSLADQRAPLRLCAELYRDLQQTGLPLDTLSMGMSGDLEAAVLEGSTLLRIGTAIFGPRTP
jgi:pyridoxal phosphate enzyme (YggS family)